MSIVRHELSLHTSFFKSLRKLGRNEQDEIPDFLNRVRFDRHGGKLNLKKLRHNEFHTARVTKSVRCVLHWPPDGGHLSLFYVGQHDHAERWFNRHRLGTSLRTGVAGRVAPDRRIAAVSDLESLLDREDRQHFWHVDDEDLLHRMLETPDQLWRVYLDPRQRELVETDADGPMRVLGGAGTGKTVVAMHRAVWLARNMAANPGNRILFLTNNSNLAAEISRDLRALVSDAEVLERIEVTNLDQWVECFLKTRRCDLQILNGRTQQKDRLWRKACDKVEVDRFWSQELLKKEFEQVVLVQGIHTLEEYLEADRSGRGIALTEAHRVELWPAFEFYRESLRNRRLVEREDAYREVRLRVETDWTRLPYVAVVVDEAQNFGFDAFRLFRALSLAGTADSDRNRECNRLFITGDAHQRIHRVKVNLGRCGIDVKGRSHRLELIYRTTNSIYTVAAHVLGDGRYDDLNGQVDTLQGYRSLYDGPFPYWETYADVEDEGAGIIVDWIKHLQHKDDLGRDDFCLLARTVSRVKAWERALKQKGLDVYCLRSGGADTGHGSSIRLATANKLEGLEYPAIAVLDADSTSYPLHQEMQLVTSEAERAEQYKQERSLLHVVCTRARNHLLICTQGPISPFLEGVFEPGRHGFARH